MLGRQSFVAHPVTRFASVQSLRTVTAKHTPRQNRLLAALPSAEYSRLLPQLEPVLLPKGWIMNFATNPQNHLYFLSAGLVSRYCELLNGTSTEFAITGSEGAIGMGAVLGGEHTPFWSEVVCAGFAYRLNGKLLAQELAQHTPLAKVLYRYLQALMAATGQIVACNRLHPLEQRLCRWLLSSMDRMGTNELVGTQELISNILGVRRESITGAVGMLESAGIIHRSRGRIILLDRARLETLACECYTVVRREYARLFPETRN